MTPTPRELEILDHVTRPGGSYSRAALELGISPNTIKTTLRILYRKLGVRNAAQAARAVSTATRPRPSAV